VSAAPLTVGVTGASGFIGSALCAALAASGDGVRRFARGRLDPAALEGLDAVVHLSGASLAGPRWTAARKHELVQSRVGSTATLARAIGSCSRPPRVLVSGSAVGWYGDRGDEPLDESSAPGRGFLAGMAHDWEAAAAPAAAAGVRVVHPRTGLVLARQGGVLAALERPFALGLGGPLAGGRAWWSWIALGDLLRAIGFALRDERLRGPFNAVSPAPVRQGEFARALGAALHRPAFAPAPAFALRILLGRERADEMLLAGQRAAPAVLLAAGFSFASPALGPYLDLLYGRSSGAR